MIQSEIASWSDAELLERTRKLVRQSCEVEADLLVLLGEIDERKLYLERAHSSMFAFCTAELGLSEAAAYNRIQVARMARKLPAIVEFVRAGRVHVTAVRLLSAHLTPDSCDDLLAKVSGKTKEEIMELVASLAPRPVPPATIRKLPEVRSLPLTDNAPRAVPAARPVAPIAEDTFKVQFAISREFRDEIREAQDLLRHRVPDGDLEKIFRAALKLLVAEVRNDRFALGRKPRSEPEPTVTTSRHIPDAIKRSVYERDGGRCTFVDDRGKRCEATGALEFDHIDGFERTHLRDVNAIRLLCRAHNQHAADKLYGRAFMDAARARR